MKKNKFAHYLKMCKINKKSYYLLSISIVVSLSILLVVLIVLDSNVYNKHKNIDNVPIGTMDIYTDDVNFSNQDNLSYLIEDGNGYSHYKVNNFQLKRESSDKFSILGNYYYVDSNYFSLFRSNDLSFYMYDCIFGSCELVNEKDIIIEKSLYDYLSSSYDINSTISLPIVDECGDQIYRDYTIVGVVDNGGTNKNRPEIIENNGNMVLYTDIFMNFSNTPSNDFINREGYLVNASDPLSLSENVRKLGYNSTSVYLMKKTAIEDKLSAVSTKVILLIVLLLILGLNIYGNFMNSLKERYIEIGIKRALGVKKKDIILQFLFEMIIVLIINLAITLFLSFNFVYLFKIILLLLYQYEYILYFNVYSMINFFIFSFFILLTCSLIFSFKAANLEIIDVIKEQF